MANHSATLVLLQSRTLQKFLKNLENRELTKLQSLFDLLPWLRTVTEKSDLGVVFDDKFSFKIRIENMIRTGCSNSFSDPNSDSNRRRA